MRFITFGYIIFLILVFLIYWNINSKKGKLILLAIASSLFYASWSLPFFFHFAFLVMFNFFLIQQIRKENIPQKTKKIFFVSALILDFGNLIFFKYFYLLLQFLWDISGIPIFTKENLNRFLLKYFSQESIILPLAISFYTFQITAYLIDIYKHKIQRKDTFLEFYVFILFFPQLVAGPIMRHSDFFFQLEKHPILDKEKIIKGFYHILSGLFKKVIIADNIANIIQPIFLNPTEYNGLTNLFAAIGYAIRVYGDFSGYTDIARGSAYLLGFRIPENFDGPFFSTSISEFWRRWHVTLSSWLRDYIYIPLGGSRVSKFRTSFNLVITFTLGGLWHGANYTYIVWGFMYGILLVIEKPFVEKYHSLIQRKQILRFSGIVYSFFFFSIGLCFFNAPDIQHSYQMLKQILLFKEGQYLYKDQWIQIFTFLIAVFILNYIQYIKKRLSINPRRDYIFIYLFSCIMIWLLANYSPQTQSFIYFQF